MSTPLRYLALGDSYTIGEGVVDGERWPEQWADALGQHGIPVAPPRIIAVTGWTTDELSAGMDAANLPPEYDLVSLLIGVNDQYRRRGAASYPAPFQQLLERAIHLAGGKAERVVVLSIPDWGVTPFGQQDNRGSAAIGHELDAFNAIAQQQALAAGAHFIDITGISRQHADMTTADGLHPSATQYTLWAKAVLAATLPHLRTHR